MNIYALAVISLLISTALSYFASPFIIKFANKAGLVDDPAKNRHEKVIHEYPVPRSGGLAVFLAFAISSIIFLPLDKHLAGILLGATFITMVGILDDKFDINPYARLLMQFVTAGFPIAAGIGIAFITSPFNGVVDLSTPRLEFYLLGEVRSLWILSNLFALFWIVSLMNFLNMGAKGIDGQLPGVAVVAALTISLLSLQFSADITQWPVIILAMITAGSFLGFLPWNFYPQKIMPGFSGSNLAGYLLAVLSILSTSKVGTLLVVLSIPLVDTSYTIARRIISGKSPVWGDRGHLHHKLLDYGLSKRQVVLFYIATTALLGILALNLNASFKLYTIAGIVVFVGGLLLWLTYRSK